MIAGHPLKITQQRRPVRVGDHPQLELVKRLAVRTLKPAHTKRLPRLRSDKLESGTNAEQFDAHFGSVPQSVTTLRFEAPPASAEQRSSHARSSPRGSLTRSGRIEPDGRHIDGTACPTLKGELSC